MSRSIAKELDNRKDGDRNACPICNPKRDKISADRVWQWSLANPGKSPLIG